MPRMDIELHRCHTQFWNSEVRLGALCVSYFLQCPAVTERHDLWAIFIPNVYLLFQVYELVRWILIAETLYLLIYREQNTSNLNPLFPAFPFVHYAQCQLNYLHRAPTSHTSFWRWNWISYKLNCCLGFDEKKRLESLTLINTNVSSDFKILCRSHVTMLPVQTDIYTSALTHFS